jgi:spermidine synthase
MQMWFSQYHTVNVKLDVRIQEQLFSGQSDYQKIDVFKSYEFGKMVALDGEIVFSDTDEFIYDEMVTHVPMAVHPNAKRILIIGGGDGGVANIHLSSILMWLRQIRCLSMYAGGFSRR